MGPWSFPACLLLVCLPEHCIKVVVSCCSAPIVIDVVLMTRQTSLVWCLVQVVLASVPDMQCGYSRELFLQWCSNPKNCVILTNRTQPGTLSRILIDNPLLRSITLDVCCDSSCVFHIMSFTRGYCIENISHLTYGMIWSLCRLLFYWTRRCHWSYPSRSNKLLYRSHLLVS